MILAYRRGLLEPDYKYGLQSQIRERLVLRMMAAEQDAALIDSVLTKKNAAIAPHVDPKKLDNYIHTATTNWVQPYELAEYNVNANRRKVSQENADIARTFIEMKKKGIIEEFRKAAAKAIQEQLDKEAENDVI